MYLRSASLFKISMACPSIAILAHIRELISIGQCRWHPLQGSQNGSCVQWQMWNPAKSTYFSLVNDCVSTLSKQEFNCATLCWNRYWCYIIHSRKRYRSAVFSTNSASIITLIPVICPRSISIFHYAYYASADHWLNVNWISPFTSSICFNSLLDHFGGLSMTFLSKPMIPNSSRPNFPLKPHVFVGLFL